MPRDLTEVSEHMLTELGRVHQRDDKLFEEIANLRKDLSDGLATIKTDMFNNKIEINDTVNNKVGAVERDMTKNIMSLSNNIAALQVKSGIWGAIGGAIPACTVLLIWLIQSLQ